LSGLVAVLGPPVVEEEAHAKAILARLATRGADRAQWWRGESQLIGVCRADWELGPSFAGGVMVLEEEHLVVAADASLYYVDDLRRALRGADAAPRGHSPSHLIAAAYRAWGDRMLERLEGDYAFLLWDRQRHRLVAARDFAGSRPLYFSYRDGRLILASSPVAVVTHPAVPRTLNRLAIGEDLIGSSSMAVGETAFSAVERLPPGAKLVWHPGATPRTEQFWEPPRFERNEGPGEGEAAGELRELLGRAVGERLAVDGATAVWTSGGYDSPAVFALGLAASGPAGRGPVFPVSMSYPPGDPGREDELIEAVGKFLGVSIHWIDVGSVPGLPDPWTWADRRDEPFAHPYEEWNRALAATSHQGGARVVLGGNGGDQFFGVSPVFLADLLRAGQWRELVAEARGLGFRRRDIRSLFHWAVQPSLPAAVLGMAARIRGGRPLRAHLQSPVPPWLTIDPLTTRCLLERQWHYGLRKPGETLGSAETRWYLTSAFGQRIATSVVGFAQQTGVEARSPMYDQRVIEFMARRPRADRFAQGETKRLLRRAMTGLLPADHLAPRMTRTGLPSAYLHRVRLAALPVWRESLGKTLQVTELGLASEAGLSDAMDRFLKNPEWEGRLGGQLFNILAAEFWIRAHGGTI
jgi:asparagine synthase (glutamine-hydrolysing)